MDDESKAEASLSKDPDVSDEINGAEAMVEAEGDAEVEDWMEKPTPTPSIGYFTPVARTLASPGALAVHSGRLALSVSSLTGRYWRGAVALADCPPVASADSEPPLLDIDALCELPAGVADLHFLGRPDRLLTGHDDGCVSLLALESPPGAAEAAVENGDGEPPPARLHPVSFAMEHDSLVRRLAVSCAGDLAASLEEGGRVKVWLLDPFVSVLSFPAYPFSAFDLAAHPRKSRLLAAAGATHSAHRLLSLTLWDLRESANATAAQPCGGVVAAEGGAAFTALAWSPCDDDWLFAGDRRGGVHLFDLRQLKEPLLSAPNVHRGWAVERMASQGAHLTSMGGDRRLVEQEVFADDAAASRLRPAGGKGFQHASMPLGLAVGAEGSWWSTEVCGGVWRHSGGEAVKCRLFPELKELSF